MSTATIMASSQDPSKHPKDGHCPWNKLSNELKDMVFDFAYVPSGMLKPIHKDTWKDLQEVRRTKEKSRFQPEAFPHSYFVERFFVSREWCTAALKFFYGHTLFDLEDTLRGAQFMEDVDYGARPYAQIIGRISMSLRTPYSLVLELPSYLLLRKLNLNFSPKFFADSTEKDIACDEWNQADFDEYRPARELLQQLHGITSIKFAADFEFWDYFTMDAPNPSRSVFEANVEVFQQVTKEVSKLPRPRCPTYYSPASPIYAPVSPSPIPMSSSYEPPSHSAPFLPVDEPTSQPFDFPTSPRYTSPQISPSAMSPPNCPTSPRYEYATKSPSVSGYMPLPDMTRATPLEDDDIPDDEFEFRALMVIRGADLLEWIKAAKQERRSKDQ